MGKLKMGLYDHLLYWLVQRRAETHARRGGLNNLGPQLLGVETKAIHMAGDGEQVHMMDGVDQIPPEILKQVIEAMGWVPYRDEHDAACPKQVDSANECNCVQPLTTWTAPETVQQVMGEDYQSRLAARS